MANDDPVVAALLERCRRDHHAWINGDGSGYALPEDGTILGGIGGYGFGGPATTARQAAVARQWQSGTGEVELLNAAVGGDIAWLAMIERAQVTFDPAVGPQRWDLRVTEVFRRVDDGWERVHRHADPLVDRRAVEDITPLLE
jgi:ketosteroid isomerase-like protein